MQKRISSLKEAIQELNKWRAEKRLVSAALMVAGRDAATFFVKGDLTDVSEARVQISGWGCAAFSIASGAVGIPVLEAFKKSIAALQGGAPIDWTESIAIGFTSTGNWLVLWSERQADSNRDQLASSKDPQTSGFA